MNYSSDVIPVTGLVNNSDPGVSVVLSCVILMLGIIQLVAWYMIFKKAGFPGCFGCLMLLPGVSFIVLLIFAFSDWPKEKGD